MIISERGIAKDPPKSARVPKVSTTRASKPKKMKAEFILLKELGRGAGGVVYKAIHVRTLNVVAIKKVARVLDQGTGRLIYCISSHQFTFLLCLSRTQVRMASQTKKKQVM